MTTSKTCNRYSTEFKLELIKLIEEHGQSVTQIAAQYQVGVSTLNKWLHQYRQELKGHSPMIIYPLWLKKIYFLNKIS